jgi:membrane-associated phospholipid phosphatase
MLLVPTALALMLLGPIATSTVATETEAESLSEATSQAQAPPAAQPAGANDPKEQPADAKEPPTAEHTGLRALVGNLGEDIKHLPSTQNLYLAAIGGGLAAAAHPADATFNAHVQSQSDAVNAFFAAGKYLGNTPEQVAFSLGTYAYGRFFDAPKVAHLGMDLFQAQILTELLVEPIKFATHRLRPDGSDHQSFPSGHAAVTFATATVIERHLGWRKSILAYVIASYVATSRLHDNKHYLSDVIFGAAVGSIAGRTVVHHAADYWSFSPVKVPGGVALLVTHIQ